MEHITRLSIDGWVGIKSLKIDPCTNRVLACGPNESGKTSIAQAIGFALRGLPERVKLKKDYGELVHDGAEEANILITQGDETRAVRVKKQTGKADGLPNPENVSPFLHCALDTHHFTRSDDKARRKILFRLGGVKATKDEILKLISDGGGNTDKAKEIENLLVAGFDQAAAKAKEKVSDCTRSWERITGEKYGKDKAEGWRMPLKELPPEAGEIEAKAKEAAESLNKARTRRQTIQGKLDMIEQVSQQIADIEHKAGERPPKELQAELEELNTQITIMERDCEELQARIRAVEGNTVETLSCPDCGAALVFENGALEPYTPPEADEAQVDEWKEESQIAAQQIRQAKDDAAKVREQIGALENAGRMRQTLATFGEPEALRTELKAVEENITALENELAGMEAEYKDCEEAKRHNADAEKRTESAAQVHNDAREWQRLRELLEPDGIPKILMEKALEPVNLALKEFADAAHWQTPEIDKNMVVTYGGRVYDLASESAQWRCDCLLSAAISYLSGVKFLLLDRADILDLPGRAHLLDLTDLLAERSMQVIICATLKAPPEFPGIQTVWLTRG